MEYGAKTAPAACMQRPANFSAGPAALPEEVLVKAQHDMLSWEGSGVSVMEMSHRSKEFKSIIEEAEASLRQLLTIPDTYKVLFLQGGGTGQFASVPLNLMGDKKSADYLVTGGWSAKAMKEAQKLGYSVRNATPKADTYTRVAPPSEWTLDPEAAYVYYCDNETVFGVEFDAVPDTGDVPLVADMSSNFLTRPIDVSKYGLIYAGVQKNAGPAGLTLVIVREDLLGRAAAHCPSVLDYKIMADNQSMLNTPPCWSIYVTGLVFKWVLANGGVEAFAKLSQEKAQIIYDAIASSGGFYSCPVAADSRSRINIPFRICRKGVPDEALEAAFIAEATKKGLLSLKGHRSVGGIRASLYNAVSKASVERLAAFMAGFAKQRST